MYHFNGPVFPALCHGHGNHLQLRPGSVRDRPFDPARLNDYVDWALRLKAPNRRFLHFKGD